MSATALSPAKWDRSDARAPAADAGERRPAQPAFMARRRHDLLAQTVIEEIVPRLVLARRSAEVAQPSARQSADDVAELARLILQPRFDVGSPHVGRISGNQPGLDAVYLDLLAPTAHRLGTMWDEDLCDFVEVTVGLMRLQEILNTLSVPLAPERGQAPRTPRVLLVPGPGDQHSFGLAMVASFFQRAGWSGWSGAPGSCADLLSRVGSEWFAVVGFSVSNELRLDALTQAIRGVRRSSRNREVGIMVGGPLFIARPELVAMVGADATAVDGRDAVLQAQRLLTLIPSRG